MMIYEPGRVFEAVIAKSMNTASRTVADEGEGLCIGGGSEAASRAWVELLFHLSY